MFLTCLEEQGHFVEDVLLGSQIRHAAEVGHHGQRQQARAQVLLLRILTAFLLQPLQPRVHTVTHELKNPGMHAHA